MRSVLVAMGNEGQACCKTSSPSPPTWMGALAFNFGAVIFAATHKARGFAKWERRRNPCTCATEKNQGSNNSLNMRLCNFASPARTARPEWKSRRNETNFLVTGAGQTGQVPVNLALIIICSFTLYCYHYDTNTILMFLQRPRFPRQSISSKRPTTETTWSAKPAAWTEHLAKKGGKGRGKAFPVPWHAAQPCNCQTCHSIMGWITK